MVLAIVGSRQCLADQNRTMHSTPAPVVERSFVESKGRVQRVGVVMTSVLLVSVRQYRIENYAETHSGDGRESVMGVHSKILPVCEATVSAVSSSDDTIIPFVRHVDGHVVRRIPWRRNLDAHCTSLGQTSSIGIGISVGEGPALSDFGDIVESGVGGDDFLEGRL